MCKTSICRSSCPRNIIIQIKLLLQEFHTISSEHTWRNLLFVRSCLAKEGFNLVLTTRNRRQPSLHKIRDLLTRYLREVRYLLSILYRPFDFSIPCCYSLFYARVTTKAHAYKFLTPRGKILIFPFTISIETYIKQVNKTKEGVYIRKELNSHRIGLMLQHGKRKCLHKKRVELSQDWFGTPTCKRKCLHKKRVEPPQDWFGTQT